MLVELDEVLVEIDGFGFYVLALWEPQRNRTFVRWTRIESEVLGPLTEVEPSKLSDHLRHPMLHVPDDLFLVPARQATPEKTSG